MTMIKLDSGDYVNTDYIERLWMINEHDGFIRFVNAPDVPISENDRGLILKAMKPKIMLTAGSDGNMGPTIYHAKDGTEYGAMAFSPLIHDHGVTDDEQ